MKTGIVGGTFDPIHIAHVYLMTECQSLLELDRMIIIPNGDPPHKDSKVTSAEKRLEMVRLAMKHYPSMEVSDMEVRSDEVSYSYLTLKKLKVMYPSDELYFIIGADSLVYFSSWKNPEKILELATLVCFDRPGYRKKEKEEAQKWISEHGGKVIMIDSLELEMSSTDIRNRISEGRPYRAFLDPAVSEYIEKNGLYREKRS